MTLILDNITFTENELDYESNGGSPVVLSSFSGIQIFDSYLISGGNEYKLYKPTPNNLLLSYKIAVNIPRDKVALINALILDQSNIVKQYRKDHITDNLIGYKFVYEDKFNTNVWLTSFTKESSFYRVDSGIEYVKCKIDVQEAE